MSKYKHNITETKQDRIMINIANEIAEANRLKIVEIKLKGKHKDIWMKPDDGGSVTFGDLALSELEDQA